MYTYSRLIENQKSQTAAYGETITAKKDSQVLTSTNTTPEVSIAGGQQLKILSKEEIIAMVNAELKRDAMKPKPDDVSMAFKFEVGEEHIIEFDPKLTKVDPNFVYGKARKRADGTLDRGMNGELYHADTGDILMSKFVDPKTGKPQPLRPVKRYIYYGWHVGNEEERQKPLRFVATSDHAKTIMDYIAHTNVYAITKTAYDKLSIRAVLGTPQQNKDEGEDGPSQEELRQMGVS